MVVSVQGNNDYFSAKSQEVRPGVERRRSFAATSAAVKRREASARRQPEHPLPELQKSAADAL
jgi:hypothetical protein